MAISINATGDDDKLTAELSGELWSAKVPTEYCINKRMDDRAKKSKIPWMILAGEKEQKEGVVRLKKMICDEERLKNKEVGEEVVLRKSDIVEELKKRLNNAA